ncbi:MAG TPA: Obg family GTPase CgtA [Candidatus Dormibacteraeota bacterium]|nr:Obg family GTPase CgtA [Candidatus Dormibacteraeota bacterium]
MFTDEVTLRVRAGRGGRGSASFRAQPFEPQGGPDGGNGGSGGDVLLRASRDLHDLSPLIRRHAVSAEDGKAGAGGRKEGRRGADLEVPVPIGTRVVDEGKGELIGDLVEDGQSLLVAQGGAGGGGNIHRVSSVNRTPTAAGPGAAGEERALRLEFRLAADVALVGKPNAGKSTLLSALTAARPKIADYPFTTPYPELGVMFSGSARPLTLVEIPSERYLRQLDRVRAVLLVVDAREPQGLPALRRLAGDRPVSVVWTKSDLVPGPHRRRGLYVSAETGVGVEELAAAIRELAATAAPRRPAEPAVRRLPLSGSGQQTPVVTIHRREWGLEVQGPRLDRLLDRYDLETPAGFDRFQVALERMGVSAALEEAGAEAGETVRIGDAEFEYQP